MYAIFLHYFYFIFKCDYTHTACLHDVYLIHIFKKSIEKPQNSCVKVTDTKLQSQFTVISCIVIYRIINRYNTKI